ncbi:MAG: Na+/H+ antiporter NhaC family protein [Melioribacteraceae bacterium]|nr:Na+/H+ antiporter NhaC family protein [Melioribacteraceae bacterium]WKZ70673.1 MAG: Na+/H+ antiporter NhaC family protein [Melioribacteraceae bacterium]
MKKTSFILFLIVSLSFLNAQEIEVPKFSLTKISFPIQIKNLPDSAHSKLIVLDSDKKVIEEFSVTASEHVYKLTLQNAGTYEVIVSNDEVISKKVRVIPGWLSIIPPLLAILLALILRQVLVSLAAGIFVGAIVIYDYNPLTALLRFTDTIIINSLIDPDHMFIIVFTLLIGGVVGVISKNGGTAGLANLITRYAKSSKSGLISSWLMGMVVFFDDYANSLIIGNMMRPITDKLKISREKLAYIVDSTAAPIASIVLISTWIGYELGLINDGLKSIGSDANAYDVFLQTIPYRFYPIAAIFFVFLTSVMRRDFGPMYKAEKRSALTGALTEKDAKIDGLKESDEVFYSGDKARWFNGVIPIFIILLGTIGGMVYTGMLALQEIGTNDYSVQNIISNADSYSSLLWASFAASIVAIIMSSWQKILKLNDAMTAWHGGVQTMLLAAIILVFAWGISDITNQLKTADYLISILSDTIDPRFLPVLVFLVCALISFSTGTSWGTMAIVMPIVIPLAAKMVEVSHLPNSETVLIINGVVSSVLAGSVFGDHCSPIADTTILSSMASHCNHIDHVKTQLPYAILVGIVCMVLGDIPTAFGLSPYISLVLIFGVLIGVLFLFGKRVPEAKLTE